MAEADTAHRRRAARRSLRAWWFATIPAGVLSVAAAFEAIRAGEPFGAALLVYVTGVSLWTGIETAHARLNADLPTEGG